MQARRVAKRDGYSRGKVSALRHSESMKAVEL